MSSKVFFFSLFFLFLVFAVCVCVSADLPDGDWFSYDDFSTDPGMSEGHWSVEPCASVTFYPDDDVIQASFKSFGDGYGNAYWELDDYVNCSDLAVPMFMINASYFVESTYYGSPYGIRYVQVNVIISNTTSANGERGEFGVSFSSNDYYGVTHNRVGLVYYNTGSSTDFVGTNMTDLAQGHDWTYIVCWFDPSTTTLYMNTSTNGVSWDIGVDITSGGTYDYRYMKIRYHKQGSGNSPLGYNLVNISEYWVGALLDNSAPVVELVSPENDNETLWYDNTYGRVNFVWNISDVDNDSMDVFLRTSDDNVTFNTTGNFNGRYNTSYMSNWLDYINGSAILPNTTYWWYVSARDAYGNWGNSSIWNFTTSNYSNLVPHYELLFPTDGLVNISTDYVDLQLRVWDFDLGMFAPHPYTDYLNVSFFDNSTGDLIGFYSASNNSTATVRWSNLNSTTLYYWYATVNDWWVSNTTDVYSFYTGYVLPNGTWPFIYDIKPYDGRVLYYSKPDIVEMGFTCWDVDSDWVDIYVYWADFHVNGSLYWFDELARVTRLEDCSSGDGERYEWDAKNSYGYDFLLNDTYYWRIKAVDSDGHVVWFPSDVGISPDSYYSFNITYDVNGEDDPNKSDDFPDWWENITESWLRWIVIACIVLVCSGLVLWVSGSIFGSLAFMFFGLVVSWGLNLLFDVEMFVVLVGLVILFVLHFLSGGE